MLSHSTFLCEQAGKTVVKRMLAQGNYVCAVESLYPLAAHCFLSVFGDKVTVDPAAGMGHRVFAYHPAIFPTHINVPVVGWIG
jgi:hypothetical protein